jgi:hypothetical protein
VTSRVQPVCKSVRGSILDAVRRLVRLGAIIAAFVPFVATVERREKPMRGTGRWSHRLVGLALLLVLPALVAAQTAITNGNIGTAATAWATSPTAAAAMYGNIADWNTAAVTSMAILFNAKPTFNADISKWNVASVSDMFQVDTLCRALQTPRLVFCSLTGRHFCTALFGLGACSCPHSDPCLAAMLAHTLCCCCIGVPFPWLGLAWDGALLGPYLSAAPERAAGMLACLRAALFSASILAYILCRTQTARSSLRFAPAPTAAAAPHLDRRGQTPRSARTRPAGRCVYHALAWPSRHGAHAARAL